ncbi:CDGSH iron-sulfur domain-containing protein [Nonomuraea aurantiaca]|jgi:CDGSH-type Zn-finger protein|uniref:CDGSH iron-sulfur domain-containing protein n=1 Tax=Nonomuraea aurantiaca TaxID=2878562 RepID=UPI001CDA21A2|nr:CDGSH iron-sulfur domain-containing protein [Nonomuraea aurantiaca]MCA2223172.1 CDGSH iron-sulfur domain-containing protein [Nonomuraea aurantiaca]
MRIEVTPDGPYVVTGSVPMVRQVIGGDAMGQSMEWVQGEDYPAAESYELCRCGRSQNKPYCDGSHERVRFDGTETASRRSYLGQAEEHAGPELALTDAPAFCAFARFCDADGQVWKLLKIPGQGETAARQATHCPSGRLTAWASRAPIEPELPPSIGIVEDEVAGVGGPIWVRGGIPVTSADGQDYEVRNRVTLCRCGNSRNKPFCDGSHVSIRFAGA